MSSTKALPTYSGAVPGADSTEYTLYQSNTNQQRYVRGYSFEWYHLVLNHSHAGTLKAYLSNDQGATWTQFDQRTCNPGASAVTSPTVFWANVSAVKDLKVTWTNGGSAQTTWRVNQSLTDANFEAPNDAIIGMPGGAQDDSLTTSEIYLDLSALARMEVKIWSDDADIYFAFNSVGSGTLITSGDQAASTTALKADRTAKSVAVRRIVHPRWPFLVVKSVTGTGTIHVKVVKDMQRL